MRKSSSEYEDFSHLSEMRPNSHVISVIFVMFQTRVFDSRTRIVPKIVFHIPDENFRVFDTRKSQTQTERLILIAIIVFLTCTRRIRLYQV